MAELGGPVLLVGCGKMGSALLAGWLAKGLAAADAYVVEPDGGLRTQVRDTHGVAAFAAPHELPTDLKPKAIVFAVKPQAMATVLPSYEKLAGSGAVVLSIAAGTPIARFEAVFGEKPIVRAMPNTPAAIGQGVTALFANPHASKQQTALCGELMAAVGDVHWIDDEEHMHAITALSGSGPAYVFHLIEVMAKAAIKSGLPEALAWPLARATVAGSGALAAASGDQPVEALRRAVTSPGGTTEAALEVLMAPDGGQPLFDRAVAAATQRSRDLA